MVLACFSTGRRWQFGRKIAVIAGQGKYKAQSALNATVAPLIWKSVRKRIRAKLWKALQRSEHSYPGCARLVSRLRRGWLPVDRALMMAVADCNCDLKLRLLGARLLRDIGGDTTAFFLLLSEF